MAPLYQSILAFAIGLIVVYYAIPVIVRISAEKHFLDEPNERKVNLTKIPNLGGIALFVGITVGTLIGMFKSQFPDWRYILAAMVILFFIGFKDDILIVSAKKKLAAQILCAAILIFLGDIRITNFHGIMGIHQINYFLSVCITMFALIGMINALNLIDGIDGLATSISFLAACCFGVLFYHTGHINYVVLCAATAGSLFSFFIYNVFGKENKIFMGDTGSLILGLILSVFAIRYNESLLQHDAVALNLSPVLSLAILSIPIFDTLRIFTIRLLTGQSPFSPDMNHIHHKFLKIGYSHIKTTIVLIISNVIIINLIFWFRAEDPNILLLLVLVTNIILMFLPALLSDYNKPIKETAIHLQSKTATAPTIPLEHKRFSSNNAYLHLEKSDKEEKYKKVLVE